jgi:hypothetical protein
MATAGLQWSSKPAEVSGGGNTGLDNGQPVRSRRREHDCGRRWQGDIPASYGCGTEKGWSLTVRKIDRDGEKNEKSSGYLPSRLGIATKRFLEKASTDPGFAPLLDSEDLEGMITDHGQIRNEGLSSIDFSRTSIAQENSTSTSSNYLIGKELMLQECRDWRQETSRTVIIKRDFYEETEG